MKKQQTTSWGGVADWYDEAVSREGSYQQDLILPNLIRLMSIKKGDHVLDIACGQGLFAREFFKKGGTVTGIDISSELVTLAKEKSPKGIYYYVASAEAFPEVKDNSIDVVTIVLSIQNIDHVKKVFQECSRVLKPQGRLFMVMNHPAFRIPKASSWGWDENTKSQYRRVDRYLSESKETISMHPGDAPGIVTVSFHRPLQYYSKLLASTGFGIARIEEWESQKQSQPGPRAKAEDIARKEIPLFLLLEVRKC